jgi:hypothetical protein
MGAAIVLPTCATNLQDLVQFRLDHPAEDAACGGQELRRQLVEINSALLRKAHTAIGIEPDRWGKLPWQLYILDRWYESTRVALSAIAPATAQETLSRELSKALGVFWSELHRQRQVDDPVEQLPANSRDQTLLRAALQESTLRGRSLEQEVLTAALTKVEILQPEGIRLDRTPLQGEPLLVLMADALTPLFTRAVDLARFHDLACPFTQGGCRAANSAPPVVAQVLALFAALGDPAGLGTAVAATTTPLLEWKDTFELLAEQQQAWAPALASVTGDPAGTPIGRSMYSLVERAAEMHRRVQILLSAMIPASCQRSG